MRKIYILFFFSVVIHTVFAQKKPLDHSVYDAWQSIRSLHVTNDGQYVLYAITPQEGDAQLIIKDRQGKLLLDIPRATSGVFDETSRYVLAYIKPFYADVRQAKIKKKKPDDMPKDTLAIVDLKDLEVEKIARVKRYKVPEEGHGWLAFLKEPVKTDKSKKDSTKKDTVQKAETKKASGNTLYLRNLMTGQETQYSDVDDFFFEKSGKQLVFVRKGQEKDSVDTKAGIYLVSTESNTVKQISEGKGTYTNITFDETGAQLAFTAEKNPKKALLKPYKLYYYTADMDTARVLANQRSAGMPEKWHVSGNGSIRFSKQGDKLFFGIAPIPPVKDTTLVDFEVAKVDIWHWKDDYLQPQQLVDLNRDRNKSYLSVIYPAQSETVIPLASIEIPDVQLTADADNEYILASTNFGRRIATQWEGGSSLDFYLVSTKDGSKQKIADQVYGYPYLSPLGKHVLWFDLATQQWMHYDIERQGTSVLNKKIDVLFGDEDNDSPTFARAYGIAGWSEDDDWVYIYDKYDIWSFNLMDNGKAKNSTNGQGRKTNTTFRYKELEPETGLRRRQNATIMHGDSTWWLSAFDHESKENGWYTLDISDKNGLSREIMGAYVYGQIEANKGTSIFVYTKENYEHSPNVYASTDFKNEIQLSHTNSQQEQYNWGTAELVHWTTPVGHDATGILYKPEDFDASQKYPMIVYFYEKLSDGLYQYIPPAPTPSRLNISYFVSNGYLVFAPDIEYEIGYPGKSAEEFVNSSVEALTKNAWVDAENIGIQGQSWGGYQVAHLITRTNMYAAAWAGAPVVNMTSAYGGIRWASGRNRQFQYEKTQSRIGKDLWEGFDLYVENSPLFHLKNVETPVVIMANDADGAVPWYQGIEMFTALRRLGKPVWMLNYNGDEHNLMLRQNRKDIQRREQQFFDHYLKGKPAPVWLEYGVPATLKGIDWGFELVD